MKNQPQLSRFFRWFSWFLIVIKKIYKLDRILNLHWYIKREHGANGSFTSLLDKRLNLGEEMLMEPHALTYWCPLCYITGQRITRPRNVFYFPMLWSLQIMNNREQEPIDFWISGRGASSQIIHSVLVISLQKRGCQANGFCTLCGIHDCLRFPSRGSVVSDDEVQTCLMEPRASVHTAATHAWSAAMATSKERAGRCCDPREKLTSASGDILLSHAAL